MVSHLVGKSGVVTVSDSVYQAVTELNKARGELVKLKALFEPGTAAHAQCEKIDDHLFEVSLKLGE